MTRRTTIGDDFPVQAAAQSVRGWLALGGASCLLLCLATAAQAQPVGDGAWASPALGRVLVAEERAPGIGVAAFGGWGVTEDVLGAGDSHHRAAGSLSVSGRPIRWLTVGLRVDGRWDHHLGAGNADESAVGDPRLLLRGDFALGDGVALGLAAILLVPGADAPSLALEATTLDVRGLLSWIVDPALGLALDLGYRFDGTARAVSRPAPFGVADLVSLGASDSDALLLGAGVQATVDAVQLFGELTADVLVESGTGASPVRLAAGVRGPLVPEHLWLVGQAEVGLGGRLPVDRAGTLVPVEPRFALSLGLVVGFAEAEPALSSEDEGPDGEPEETVVDDGTRRGRVLDPSGAPIGGATVRVAAGPSTTSGPDGTFTLSGVPRDAVLVIEAEGYRPQELAPGADLEISLARDLPTGALRGLVRSRNGRPLSAHVVVEPGHLEATTDEDGVFEIELAPGRYEVSIEADGHVTQNRTVEVEVDGVTVLNADLGRRR